MTNTNRITRLLGCLAIIGPLHMIEQLIFGIDEFYVLKKDFAGYYRWFSNPDYGTVILITLGVTLLFICVYAVDKGGSWRLGVVSMFALLSVGEVHHVIRVIVNRAYNPGVITSVPFIAIGVLLLRAVMGEKKSGTLASQSVAA